MKNFSKNVIPMHQIGFPIQVPFIPCEDDSVRLLFEVTEGLDYTKLYETYSTLGRNPAIDPVILFRILLYGYMNKLYSSREIERACKRDINFMWLLQGQKAPDHNTIARFRTDRLDKCLDDLFHQFIKKLGEMNEITYENIFIDGTKIEANANKYTFVWKKATDKFENKLQEKIKITLEEIALTFEINIGKIETKVTVNRAKKILNKLDDIKISNNITFVYGKGNRKSKLQKYTEALETFIEKQEKYDSYNSKFDGRNSFSKTDVDATFMHMKEDHMKNGQLKPGYNLQIGVEGEYIVGIDVSSERSDQLTLIPFLDKLEEGLSIKYENIVADAGYESEENYKHIEKKRQNSYIKPQNYEKSKSKKFRNDISKRENMIYNTDEDLYICAFGKNLIPVATKEKQSKSGFVSVVTIYECFECDGCPYKSKCTKAKGNKRLQVSKDFKKYREKSQFNISTTKGKLLRMNRSIQVEGAFGVL
ncbi:IS1182 family transposase, partial [Clostridium chrysemydis]|uniref:IS1182 family transposase n=1 Tax=Clostridium chrysemydis TaxID=2665504 RepID=UPI003F32FE31